MMVKRKLKQFTGPVKWTVDRIEEGYVVLEVDPDLPTLDVPLAAFGEGCPVNEGDSVVLFVFRNGESPI